jgi:ribosomal protein S18 acetylase RimI-like enzyme
MDDLIIREMVMGDYSTIIEIWEECGLPYKPSGRDHPDSIEKEMNGDQNSFLVAEIHGEIVGSILVTHDGRKGWINRLSVRREHRKIGIARALVSEAEKWLMEQGIGIFACFIEGDNPISKKVFERLGYLEFENISYYTKRTRPDI